LPQKADKEKVSGSLALKKEVHQEIKGFFVIFLERRSTTTKTRLLCCWHFKKCKDKEKVAVSLALKKGTNKENVAGVIGLEKEVCQ